MKICLLAQYYLPVPAAPAMRAQRFVKALRTKHDITVLTGMPNFPTGRLPKKYRGRFMVRERVDGTKTLRTYEYPTANIGYFKRTINFVSFFFSSIIGSFYIGPQDLLIVSSPPPTVLLAGKIISFIKRCSYIVDLRDLWPESMIELEYSKPSIITTMLSNLTRAITRGAQSVLCVSEAMRQEIANKMGIDPEKIVVVHNVADTVVFKPMHSSKKKLLHISNDKMVVSFIGNISRSYNFDVLLSVATSLPEVEFVVIGDGEEKNSLQNRVNELGIPNIRLMPAISNKKIPQYINASDMGIIPLRKTKLMHYTMPAKIFEYLACGKPVVGFCSGELCKVIKSYDARCSTDGIADTVEAIRYYKNNPKALQKVGKTCREISAKQYSLKAMKKNLLYAVGKK